MARLWRHRHHPDPTSDVDQQSLILHDTQLVHWALEGEDLILDLWGGQGSWMGFRHGALAATAEVTQPPAFTVRAHLSHLLDLGLLSQLDRLSNTSCLLTVRIDSVGAALMERPVRLELSDGVERLRVDSIV